MTFPLTLIKKPYYLAMCPEGECLTSNTETFTRWAARIESYQGPKLIATYYSHQERMKAHNDFVESYAEWTLKGDLVVTNRASNTYLATKQWINNSMGLPNE